MSGGARTPRTPPPRSTPLGGRGDQGAGCRAAVGGLGGATPPPQHEEGDEEAVPGAGRHHHGVLGEALQALQFDGLGAPLPLVQVLDGRARVHDLVAQHHLAARGQRLGRAHQPRQHPDR